MEETQCIFCHIDSDQIAIEENGYRGCQCPQCGLIYVSPRPSPGAVVDLYGHDNAQISAQSHITQAYPKRLHARHHLRLIRPWLTGGTLLEIGAGAGYFLDEARRAGYDPYGLELNPLQAQFIRDQLDIPCQEQALSSQSYGGRKFDAVFHCDVISHFFDPVLEFNKINSTLKPGGLVMFETGNFGEMAPRYFKLFQRFQYPDHLFFFTVNNLENLLARTGFKILQVHRYSILPELWLENRIVTLKSLFSPKTPQNNSTPNTSPPHDCPPQRFRSIQRRFMQYLYYCFRYKLGALTPKSHRPQTVIIIARKK